MEVQVSVLDSLADQTHQRTFKSAFDDGRVSRASTYWGPIGHDWYELATPPWSIATIAVPAVPMPFGLEYANPKHLYPEVKKAGSYIAGLYGHTLYWNPRNGAWVKATKAGASSGKTPPPLPPCVGQMTRELEALDALYRSRTLQEDEWREQRQRVIEGCLGTAGD